MNVPTTAAWTIGQLATRVAEALAAGVPGQANGRVREVPDVRTLRWYTSIGLLDRPAAMRGRTALYGRRHLLQVVAVKRLQGEGWSLAEIQERLIGAGDAALEGIAALPEVDPEVDVEADSEPEQGVSRDLDVSSDEVAPTVRRARFWAPAPAGPDAPAPAASVTPSVTLSRSATPPRPAARASRVADTSAVEAELSVLGIPPRHPLLAQAIRLAADVTLVLDTGHPPDPTDLAALAEAARPLLDLLQHLGLSEP